MDFTAGGRECLTMIPDASITLDAVRVSQGTHAGMSAQTFPTMADPGFTEVTHCPLEDKRKITEQKDFRVFPFHS